MAVGLAAYAGSAAAQDAAAAGAQFDRGLTEMQSGRYQTGCPALAESYRLDPRPGTLFTLAECNAKWGKVATAVGQYEDYLGRFERMPPDQQASQRGREKIAAQQRDALKPTIPTLMIELGPSVPPGSVVQRDGVELGAPSMGVPLPIDPGEHRIVVKSPDGKQREQRVQIAASERKSLRIELDAPAEGPRVVVPPTTTTTTTPEGSDPGTSRKTWAYVAGGVGAVGLVIGATTGILALGKKSTIDDHCVDLACDAEGKRAADQAKSLALISTIGFGVGLAGLATGIVLLVTAPSAKSGAVRPFTDVRATGAVAGVEGSF
jgi:hypothetical protein